MIPEDSTDKQYFSTFNSGLIAQSLGLDEKWVAAAKLRIRSHIAALIEARGSGFTGKGLRTLSATCHKLWVFTKYHLNESEEGVIERAVETWQSGGIVVPFAMEGGLNRKKKRDKIDGCRRRGGMHEFLKKSCPREWITDAYGDRHFVPAAPRQAASIRECFDLILTPLKIATLTSNGRAHVTSATIDNLPLLFVTMNVIEEMTTERYCFEAVPIWHRSFRYEYNYVFGADTYHRMPEEGGMTVEAQTYEAMVEEVEEMCPSVEQSPEKAIMMGSQLGMKYVEYCCQKIYTIKEKCVEGAIRIKDKIITFGKSTKRQFGEMTRNIGESVTSALKTGAIASFGLVRDAVATVDTELDGLAEWLAGVNRRFDEALAAANAVSIPVEDGYESEIEYYLMKPTSFWDKNDYLSDPEEDYNDSEEEGDSLPY